MTQDEKTILLALAAGLFGYWFAKHQAKACACSAASAAAAEEQSPLAWLANWQAH